MQLASLPSRFFAFPEWLPWLHALIATLVLLYMQKPFFYPGGVDGFSVGMHYIATASQDEWMDSPLYFVHMVRFIAVYPFWLVQDTALAPLLNALGMMGAMWPLAVTTLSRNKTAHPLRSLFFYLPLFVSFRATLVVAGIGYVFLMYFKRRQSAPWLLISGLMANLSSASLIVWLLGMLVQGRQFVRRPLYYIAIILAILSIGASLSHKVPYFKQFTTPDELQISTESRVVKPLPLIGKVIRVAVQRNTIVVSAQEGNTARALVYTGILLMLLYSIARCMRHKLLRWNIGLFLLLCCPMFLLEGLGVVCLIGPLVILLSEQRRENFPGDSFFIQPTTIR